MESDKSACLQQSSPTPALWMGAWFLVWDGRRPELIRIDPSNRLTIPNKPRRIGP